MMFRRTIELVDVWRCDGLRMPGRCRWSGALRGRGQAGNLITAYALAIVVGGPILTLWLARFEKRKVLLSLMALFIAGNLMGAVTTNYTLLLVSRVIAGLTQGPFYGIGAVVATKLVSDKLAGQAVGQMFAAGLTLANVLGVPAGTWIGNALDWNMTF